MAYNRTTLWKYLHDRYNFSLQVDSQDDFVRDVFMFVDAQEEEQHVDDGGDDHEVSEFHGLIILLLEILSLVISLIMCLSTWRVWSNIIYHLSDCIILTSRHHSSISFPTLRAEEVRDDWEINQSSKKNSMSQGSATCPCIIYHHLFCKKT